MAEDLKGVNPAIQWTEKHLRDLKLQIEQLNQNTDEIENLLNQINSSIGSIGGVPTGKTKTALLKGNQTTVILTPGSGKRLRILGAALSQEISAAECGLKFANSEIQILFQSDKAGALFVTCRIEGAVNEGVSAIVEDAASNDRFFFLINYEEF